MPETSRNNPMVEETHPNGEYPNLMELLITAVFLPLAALVMWYLGTLSDPDLTWDWNAYLMNLLYSVFFVLAMRQSMQASRSMSWLGTSQKMRMILGGLITYLLLQTAVIFLLEGIADLTIVGLVYAIGIALAATYIALRVFLFQARESVREKSPGMLKARLKGRTLYVNLEKVELLYTENKVSYAFAEGKILLLNPSLTDLEERLSQTMFFRINRQNIVNRRFVSHFERKANHTLALQLEDYPETLTVSRAKTPAFIAWMKPEQKQV